MVAEGLKEKLPAADIGLGLAVLTAISGKSYTIASATRSNQVIIPFSIATGQFFIEI